MDYLSLIYKENDMLKRFILGDRKAARTFFKEYGGIIKYAVSSVGIRNSIQSKDDIYMDTIAYLLANDKRVLRMYKGDSKLSTYLYTVCRRYAISQVNKENKRESHQGEINFDNLAEEMKDTLEITEHNEFLKKALHSAISQCDDNTKIFIRMAFYDKKTCQEIMSFFGWNSENTVYARKNKTIKKLLKKIQKELPKAYR